MKSTYKINPKALEHIETGTFQELDPDTKWLFLKAYVWCEINGTSGFIPKAKLHEIELISPLAVVDAVAESGHWDGKDRMDATLDFLNRIMS